jgi:hypothetical protein
MLLPWTVSEINSLGNSTFFSISVISNLHDEYLELFINGFKKCVHQTVWC